MITAYQINNSDGYPERFIVETVPKGKLVLATQFGVDHNWDLTSVAAAVTVGHKRRPEDTELLYHSRLRATLYARYGNRFVLYTPLSTKLK
jgi:hypothetical protein